MRNKISIPMCLRFTKCYAKDINKINTNYKYFHTNSFNRNCSNIRIITIPLNARTNTLGFFTVVLGAEIVKITLPLSISGPRDKLANHSKSSNASLAGHINYHSVAVN